MITYISMSYSIFFFLSSLSFSFLNKLDYEMLLYKNQQIIPSATRNAKINYGISRISRLRPPSSSCLID